jgi:predicted TIM-barrel fold metal-dependent hydrolase
VVTITQEYVMSVHELQAIDVHGHYGRYRREGSALINEFMTGDAATVVGRAQEAKIRLTIVSPLEGLLPRGKADAAAANEEAARVVGATEGLLQWVIVDPRRARTYEQAAEMLGELQCVGIKIHPEEHVYRIAEHGPRLFEFAAKQRAVVLAHSGDANSLPAEMVALADRFPEIRVILAHLGNGFDDDPSHQVRAIQKSKQGNVYVDTSSARSITSGLIEWAVKEIGSERILFGTDTPLYFAPMQRARIDSAAIGEADKQRILCDNAASLFHF